MVKYLIFVLAGIIIAFLIATIFLTEEHKENRNNTQTPEETDEEKITALIKGLESPDPKARGIFHRNLVDETGMFFGFKPTALPEEREVIVSKWEKWWSDNSGKSKETWLIESLSLDSYRGKPLSLKKLKELQSKKSIPAIMVLLSNEDSSLRALSAETLGELKAQEATKDIINLLQNDNNIEVKRASARALGRIKGTKALEALAGTDNIDDDLTKIEAASALAIHAPEKSLNVLQSLLEKGNTESKIFAFNILEDIALIESVPILTKLLNSKPVLAEKAYKTLKNITGKDLGLQPQAWIEWYESSKEKDVIGD